MYEGAVLGLGSLPPMLSMACCSMPLIDVSESSGPAAEAQPVGPSVRLLTRADDRATRLLRLAAVPVWCSPVLVFSLLAGTSKCGWAKLAVCAVLKHVHTGVLLLSACLLEWLERHCDAVGVLNLAAHIEAALCCVRLDSGKIGHTWRVGKELRLLHRWESCCSMLKSFVLDFSY